jgi:hypothetical protein
VGVGRRPDGDNLSRSATSIRLWIPRRFFQRLFWIVKTVVAENVGSWRTVFAPDAPDTPDAPDGGTIPPSTSDADDGVDGA